MKTLLVVAMAVASLMAQPPGVGQSAPDFALKNLEGKTVRLSEHTGQGEVVLIVLRGFPGYQCPLCNRQVQEFVSRAGELKGRKVLLVYPGPPEKGAEFVADKNLPGNMELLLDTDYAFTNLYQLRWDAPKETAYPSTFVLERGGKIRYAKVSKTHGGRASVSEVVQALEH
jgi:peroxiredoxin